MAQRLPGGAGSQVSGHETPEQLEDTLRTCSWEPYSHPSIAEGCTAFKTTCIVGREGLLPLQFLAEDRLLTLDDVKGTGFVSCTVAGVLGIEVNYTVIILGGAGGTEPEHEIVWTFHPGAPVPPSEVRCAKGMHGLTATMQQVRDLGLTFAKIIA
ncbi:MAG: hypothetical protein Q7S87_08665 [Agitococcus sp.]|nr:hypothetical protein [Agitococcus sp.]